MIMLSHVMKEKQVLGRKFAISPNGEKPANKHTKPKQKKKHTFENNLKHAKMQCIPKMKFKFGTWGRTKDIKMKKKFIFKGKMHILKQRFLQMAYIQ